MFSAIRRRIHVAPATAIAIGALVFAMTGGAYAANKFLITSTKQISPKVLKSLKGASGKNGPAGPAGPAAPAGAGGVAGPQGSAGAKGETGAPGAPGAKGENGAPGTDGKDGKTGFTKTLPPGEIETGVWAGSTGPTAGEGVAAFPISFTIPVEPSPKLVYVGPNEDKPAEGCPGLEGNRPLVTEEDTLCVYAAFEHGSTFLAPITAIENPGPEREGTEGVGPAGTALEFNCTSSCFVHGVWAVMAE